MKTKIVKNYLDRIVSAIFCLLVLVYSQCGYAVTMDIPVEIQCSNSPVDSSWVIFNGQPDVQYTLTTNGIREFGKEDIAEVYEVRGTSKTQYGVRVYIGANCMSSDKVTNISLTGSSLTCKKGEGIEVRMVEPNDINLDKYHYVGTLTINIDEKKEAIIGEGIKRVSQLDLKLINPADEISFGFV